MKARLLAFTAVGAIGFIVQLTSLWILTSHLHVHYLAATLVATELAILLNFVCHESWTWADRPAASGDVARRFVRFHIANGAISLAGVAIVMPFLIELGHLHFLVANVLTVGICSAANFLAADRLVFRNSFSFVRFKPDPTAPDPTYSILIVTLLLAASGAPLNAAELRAETIDAFNRYIRVTESRMDGELHGKAPFLHVDRLPEADRVAAYARLSRGETVVSRLVSREAGREIDSQYGLIHHWVGTAFAPRATVDRAVALMQNYDRYQDTYAPNVRRSRTISREGDTFRVYLQLFMKKVISVVLNTENDVRYTRLSPTRAHVRSYSTKITEVENPGTPEEKERPVGQDNGFLWRFNNYCSLEQRSEGTYVQCESVSLSRAIPTGLGWVVGPFVTSIPRESLESTLGNMRTALGYSGK